MWLYNISIKGVAVHLQIEILLLEILYASMLAVIGCVRQKYSILQGIIPIDFVAKKVGKEIPAIDRIVRMYVCLLYHLNNQFEN